MHLQWRIPTWSVHKTCATGHASILHGLFMKNLSSGYFPNHFHDVLLLKIICQLKRLRRLLMFSVCWCNAHMVKTIEVWLSAYLWVQSTRKPFYSLFICKAMITIAFQAWPSFHFEDFEVFLFSAIIWGRYDLDTFEIIQWKTPWLQNYDDGCLHQNLNTTIQLKHVSSVDTCSSFN